MKCPQITHSSPKISLLTLDLGINWDLPYWNNPSYNCMHISSHSVFRKDILRDILFFLSLPLHAHGYIIYP